jgi:alkylhydroperoxidase family enzyme
MQARMKTPGLARPDLPGPAAIDEPFLEPVEKPRSLMVRLVYFMSRRQFGKVMTPLKVFVARMPLAFGQFVGKIGQLDKKLSLPRETVMLLREQVAHINVCLFCIDIGRYYTIQASMNQAKFDALEHYSSSPLFTEAERAALDYVTGLTREKKVDPATFARLAGYYTERQICEIVWLVATEHVYNISNIGLNIHSDMLCDLAQRSKSAS